VPLLAKKAIDALVAVACGFRIVSVVLTPPPSATNGMIVMGPPETIVGPLTTTVTATDALADPELTLIVPLYVPAALKACAL